MKKLLPLLFLSFIFTGCSSFPETVESDIADAIIINGKIYTVDSDSLWAEAVAIQDGKYVAIGNNDDIRKWQGLSTNVIDLAGAFAMPGINDAHIHPIMGGVQSLYECSFGFTATPDEITSALSECVQKRPKGEWLKGGQFGSGFFEQYNLASPRQFLDNISTDHPIFLNDDSGHNAWVNSAALEIAGITKNSPDPDGGTFVRDKDGNPNGVLLENAARLFDSIIPEYTEVQMKAAFVNSMHMANEYGITGLKDAGGLESAPVILHALDQDNLLTLHAAACIRTPYGHREEILDYDSIVAERASYQTDNVHVNFVKLFLDGVPTPARTAAMVHPYLPDQAHGDQYTGFMHLDTDLLKQDLIELDRLGFTVKIHAAGDGSVRTALDAIEAARDANGASERRHEIAHAGYIDPIDLPRFSKLNAVADFSPYLWHPSSIIDAVISAVGLERGAKYWPTRDLIDDGANILAGSDWPAAVPDANPWIGIEALVTRADPRGLASGTLWPEQAIELSEALEIYTMGGARALRLEDKTGSVSIGKFADLIVLDRNLFEIPPTDIGDVVVSHTYFKGQKTSTQSIK